jgi:hypothetical protein
MAGLRRWLRYGEVLNQASRLPGLWEGGVRLRDLLKERPLRRRLAGLSARRPAPKTASSGHPAVLIVSPHSWRWPLLVEIVVAQALRQRGIRVTLLACDGALTACDNRFLSFDPSGLCRVCWGRAKRLIDTAGLDWLSMSELAAANPEPALVEAIDAVDEDGLDGLILDGLPLWPVVYTSYVRSMRGRGLATGRLQMDAVRRFLRSGVRAVRAMSEAIRRSGCEAILALNGKFMVENAAFRLARSKGIRFVSYEAGAVRSGTLHVHRDRAAADFDFEESWRRRERSPLSATEREEIVSFMSRRRGGEGNPIRYLERPDEGQVGLARSLGLDPSKPLIAVFTNILWDSAVIDKDSAFDGIRSWLRAIVMALGRLPDRQAVIRVHPAELRVPRRRSADSIVDVLRDLGALRLPNLAVLGPDDPRNSYSLMGAAEAVHVYTSTIGLDAAALGHLTVVGGRPHYSRKGFTLDLDTGETLGALLSGRSRARSSPEAVERALLYAHHYFFERMLAFPVAERDLGGMTDATLMVDSPGELLPGLHPGLDEICEALLSPPEPAGVTS